MPSCPDTRRGAVCETMHGVEVADPYRWLEDGKSAETRAWIAAQQAHAAPYFTTPERASIRARLSQLMRVEQRGLPIERNGCYFFSRRSPDQQRSAICCRKGLNGKDEVLIDPTSMSADKMTGVHIMSVTPDGSRLVYGVRRGGEDEFAMRVLQVDSRRDLPDVLPRARYGLASWRHDGSGFYYDIRTEDGPRIRFHRIGTDPSDDREIIGSSWGPDHWAYAYVTDDGRHLIINTGYRTASTYSGDRSELYFRKLDPDGAIVPMVSDLDAHSSGIDGGDALILHTNWKAPNGRVFRIEFANPSRDAWREIVPEGKSVIESVAAVAGKVVVTYLEDVSARVRVFEPDGTSLRDIELPGPGSVSGVTGRWRSAESFFQFSSMNYAPTIFRYDWTTGERKVWWRDEGAPNLDEFEWRLVWFTSKDGTRIPMQLFHRRGLALDGQRPVLLGGYGGYNISPSPAYDAMAVVWAEAGGVSAWANIRGGGEFGEQWHQAGRREKKQNVFDDFIAAAEWLIANRYTRPEKLAIIGASNGGLLMGAALTQRPDLYRAVICHRPLLDMIRMHLHSLGPYWIGEYGCADDPEQFRYLYAYSPYHNVRAGTRYPAVLLVTGDADTRCDPMHARKMTAALQWASGSGRPILLHYRGEAGHLPTLPLDASIDEEADQLAFLFRELEMTAP